MLIKACKKGTLYSIPVVNNKSFIVESHSNDDYGAQKYIDELIKKNNNSKVFNNDLLATFCPTRGMANNDSKNYILNSSFFQQFSDIYFFYLEYKWDYHAKLIIDPIISYYNGINNLHHIIINSDKNIGFDKSRLVAKVTQIKNWT